MIDDAELLRRYAGENSEAAFAELVRRHLDFVHAVALRQANGNTTLAADVAQVVFTDLARKAGTLARHTVLVAWLHTATRFAVAKAIRGEARREGWERRAHEMNEILRDTDEAVDWARLQPVLDEVLGELKDRERTAVLLRFFEKKPLAEVGAQLALTESAARACVDRALDKMHGLLARRGVTSTAAALGLALAGQTIGAAPVGLAASVTSAALAGAAVAGGVSGAAVGSAVLLSMNAKMVTAVAVSAVVFLSVGTYVGISVATPEKSPSVAVAPPSAVAQPLPKQTAPVASPAPVAATGNITKADMAALFEGDQNARKALFDKLVAQVSTQTTMQAAMAKMQRTRVLEGYKLFVERMGLSGEQRAKFENVLGHYSDLGSLVETQIVASAPGSAERRLLLGVLRDVAADKSKDMRTALGGDEKLISGYLDYTDRQTSIQAVEKLRRSLSGAAQLSAEQVALLEDVLHQERKATDSLRPSDEFDLYSTLDSAFAPEIVAERKRATAVMRQNTLKRVEGKLSEAQLQALSKQLGG